MDTRLAGDAEYEDVATEQSGAEVIVQRDGDLDLRFCGERIAHVSSSDNGARQDYSGDTGRWCELTLYRTAGGKYICQQVGRTRWLGEQDRHSGQVCATEAEVIAFFGAELACQAAL